MPVGKATVLGLAAALLAAGCSDRSPPATPLPTKAVIDRANQGLDAAQSDEAKRREEIDRATK